MSFYRPSLRHLSWDLERFGFGARGLLMRLRGRGSGLIVITVPKAGTHLIERILCRYPIGYRQFLPTVHTQNIERYGGIDGIVQRSNGPGVIFAHLPATERYKDAMAGARREPVFMLRHPCAVVVSEARFILREPRHPVHGALKGRSLTDSVAMMVDGVPEFGIERVETRLGAFSGWLDSPALVVRFEDLIGKDGGGDDDTQRRVLSAIAAHMDAPVNDERFRALQEGAFFRSSQTFASGRMDGWREVLGGAAVRNLERRCSDLITRWGYGE